MTDTGDEKEPRKFRFRIRPIMLVPLLVGFCSAFILTAFQTTVTPMTNKAFHWNGVINSLLLAVCALIAMLFMVFRPSSNFFFCFFCSFYPTILHIPQFIIRFVSRCIGDRVLVLAGLIILIISMIFDMFVNYGNIAVFLVGTAIFMVGYSLVAGVLPALYSKLISIYERVSEEYDEPSSTRSEISKTIRTN